MTKTCSKCQQMIFKSYFLYKTDIEISQVCFNAWSKCCEDCEEPECELGGWVKAK